MKRHFLILLFIITFSLFSSYKGIAQCSICAKTTQQMGEKPARGFNTGIIYLMLTPFAAVAFIGYRWWIANKEK